VIYRNPRPVYEERHPVLSRKPLVHQGFDLQKLQKTFQEYY
jgi:hypothetical protein